MKYFFGIKLHIVVNDTRKILDFVNSMSALIPKLMAIALYFNIECPYRKLPCNDRYISYMYVFMGM